MAICSNSVTISTIRCRIMVIGSEASPVGTTDHRRSL
jgi:hypothetical protein